MRRRDWLLLLLIGAPDEPDGLDPVRLQKGAFLLGEEGGLPAAERYEFVPYNYGPMSRGVYGDAERLIKEGLAERVVVAEHRWPLLLATAAGRTRAERLIASAAVDAKTLRELRRIRHEIVSVGFTALLADIYDRYPRYAVNSVFRRGEDRP